MKRCMNMVSLFFLLSTGLNPVIAQPSGGPYGPIPRTYSLPAGAGRIYFVSADGDSAKPGKELDDPTTLEAAISRVHSGDAIIMRGGTVPYRQSRPQSGRNDSALCRRASGAERDIRSRSMAESRERTVGHEMVSHVSFKTGRLVAAGQRGKENTLVPLQQRHGFCRREVPAGGWMGRRGG